jgi:cytochrome c553
MFSTIVLCEDKNLGRAGTRGPDCRLSRRYPTSRMRFVIAVSALLCAETVPVESATLEEKLAPCLSCHGEKGQSENVETPSLGAQPSGYLLIQIYMFREKMRKVDIMNDVTKGLTDDDLREFSDAIAKLPAPVPVGDASDQARIAHAQALIGEHRCNFCHAPDFAGQQQIPRLAAQREDYLLKALRGYKSGQRPGYDPAMASVVEPLKDEDFVDLAYYLARVK